MIISRKSAISGKVYEREILITKEEAEIMKKAQNILYKMSTDDKEFFLHGTPPEEWRKCVEEDL